MRKLVKIEDIYTKHFFYGQEICIMMCPFVGFANEIIGNFNIRAKDTAYYKWLKLLLDQNGQVWRSLRSDKDLVLRVKRFKRLVRSLMDYGYQRELEEDTFIENNRKYGGLTAEIENGKIYLVDGSHRISIMIALGVRSVELDIFKIEGEICE